MGNDNGGYKATVQIVVTIGIFSFLLAIAIIISGDSYVILFILSWLCVYLTYKIVKIFWSNDYL